jgi:hypothetical protein
MRDLPPRLVRLALAVALPGVACIGWYGLEDLAPEYAAWALPVVLAYPLALIGAAGGVALVLAPARRTPLRIGLCIAAVLLPALLWWALR